ncbi:hypothetical protein [Helicobacter bilis]|uniref:hypothetical protein n=1 Tax=Helicobacter bilis TaxID=37372 RepID=UPI001E2FF875|nr:hypothetical protein [Helicobacter bilis]
MDFKRKVKIFWNLRDSVLCLILLTILMISNIARMQRNINQIIPRIKPKIKSIVSIVNP